MIVAFLSLLLISTRLNCEAKPATICYRNSLKKMAKSDPNRC